MIPFDWFVLALWYAYFHGRAEGIREAEQLIANAEIVADDEKTNS